MKTSNIVLLAYFLTCSILFAGSLQLKGSLAHKPVTFKYLLGKYLGTVLFTSIDKDGNGYLNEQEFSRYWQNVYKSHRLPVPLSGSVHYNFKEIDRSGDGRISVQEFLNWFYLHVDHDNEIVLHSATNTAFRKMGGTDGKISVNEYLDALNNFAAANEITPPHDDVLRGSFYSGLGSGEQIFKPHNLYNLVHRTLVDEPLKDRLAYQSRVEASHWPEITTRPLIVKLLVDSLFQMDTVGRGSVTMTEFFEFYNNFVFTHGWESFPKPDLKSLYNRIDHDRNGLFSKSELARFFFNEYGHGKNDESFLNMASFLAFNKLDAHRDGKLSAEEFANGLTRFAASHRVHGPSKASLHNLYKEFLTSDNVFNISNFRNLVASILKH